MKNILVIIILALSLCSCDDWLDSKPKSKLVPETTNDLEKILFNEEAPMFYEIKLLNDMDMPQRYSIVDGTEPVSSAHFFNDKSIKRTNYIEESSMYTALYREIADCNIILGELGKVSDPDHIAPRVEAEAKFYRAWCHFILAQIYCKPYHPEKLSKLGGIAYNTEFNIEAEFKQLKLQQVYENILADIENVEDLPLKSVVWTTFNRAAGHGFRAMVHLYRRDFQACREECDKALELNGTIDDMVEYIEGPMEIPWALVDQNLWSMCPGSITYGVDYDFFNKLWVEQFEEGDARYDIGIEEASGYFGIKGSYRYNTKNKYIPNVYGITVPDVMHMKAECLAREGDIEGAMNLIHQVRKKRFAAHNLQRLTASTKAEAISHIMEEQTKEKIGGYRLFHLKRLSLDPDYRITIRKYFVPMQGDPFIIEVQPDDEMLSLPFPKNLMDYNKSFQHNTEAL